MRVTADFGDVATEDSASVSGETSDSSRFGNDSKQAISTKRLKLMDEFEDDDSDSDSSQRLHNIFHPMRNQVLLNVLIR